MIKSLPVTISIESGPAIEDDAVFPEDTIVTVKAAKNFFKKFYAFSIEAARRSPGSASAGRPSPFS